MRLASGAILIVGLGAALTGCPEQNVNPDQYPDGWWLAGADAGSPWVAAQPPEGVSTFKLNAVAANGTSMVAVGDDGIVFVYDAVGEQWTLAASPVTARLNAIAAASATEFWIAGASKTVLRWDGNAFTQYTLPGLASPELKAVAATATQVWAAGEAGARFLYDVGTDTWTDLTLPLGGADITALWSSGTSVWATDYGQVIYWIAGTTWLPITDLLSGPPVSIWGRSDSDFWIVGENSVAQCIFSPLAANLTCIDRARDEAATGAWHAVWGTAADQVWIGAQERALLEWTGSGWEPPDGFALGGRDVLGLGGSAQVGTWAVGDNVLQRLRP